MLAKQTSPQEYTCRSLVLIFLERVTAPSLCVWWLPLRTGAGLESSVKAGVGFVALNKPQSKAWWLRYGYIFTGIKYLSGQQTYDLKHNDVYGSCGMPCFIDGWLLCTLFCFSVCPIRTTGTIAHPGKLKQIRRTNISLFQRILLEKKFE